MGKKVLRVRQIEQEWDMVGGNYRGRRKQT